MNFFVRYIFWGVLLFEGITAYLVGVGVWPQMAVWFSLGALSLFLLLASPLEALKLTIASIPFYLVLPNPYFDSFSAWRIAFLLLFIVWAVKQLWINYKEGDTIKFFREVIKNLFAWDKFLLLFLGVSVLSILLARFPLHSVRQIIFLINAGLLYVVIVNVVKNKAQLWQVVRAGAFSLGLVVVLGYVQFISTLFTEQYYFWQYWALLVSKAYYGLGLANVLTYSNSWFSYTGGQPTLRMFSIMPDSHSFGVLCFFLLSFLLAFLPNSNSRKKTFLLWTAIVLTAWALILSGTRGAWVGMLVPLGMASFMYWKNIARIHAKRFLLSGLIVLVLFISSPVLVSGLNLVRSGLGGGNYLDRVSSIYDLEEQSNAGRLVIWKDSLVYSMTHPLGVGYGNFIVSLVHEISPEDKFEELGDKKNLRYNLPQKFITAHSLYLNILVELGVIGITVFALLWWNFALKSWNFLKKFGSGDNDLVAFAATGSLSLLWLLAYGAFDLTLFNDKVLALAFVILALTGLIFRNYERYQNNFKQ